MEEYRSILNSYEALIRKVNKARTTTTDNYFNRYEYPVLTSEHIPPDWIYDLDSKTNRFGMARLGVNAVFNAGAIFHDGKFKLVARIEGYDRKSFFAIAESSVGTQGFEFKSLPVRIEQLERYDTNVYDMRLTLHEDGYIYGLFCTERRPLNAPPHDQSAAEASCGIVRTKDLVHWDRLSDLKTNGSHQRNVVLHPELINGKYGLYTRPQDGFIDSGTGGGIGWSLVDTMENAAIENEIIVDPKCYHTINELKNGQGPPPLKTDQGWVHLAHGVRNTAAGLRYVLYLFMTDLSCPWKIIHKPGGYYMAPINEERVGDVSNVLFANGWIADANGKVYIYYASSDTRTHVATTTIEKLVDYCLNTPEDAGYSHISVDQRISLIEKNRSIKNEKAS